MSTATIVKPSPVFPPAAASGAVGFEMMLDRSTYVRTLGSSSLTATLILRCPADTPVPLSFANSQHFDLALFDAGGQQIGLWSTGRVFSDLAQTIEFKGEHSWTATMALPIPGGTLSTASYYATGYLNDAVVMTLSDPGGGMQPDSVEGGSGVKSPIYLPPAAGTGGRRYSATVAFTVQERPAVLMSPNA